VISVGEAPRLLGYPDWFRFHTTNWHGHRQVGNIVPPPLARAAAVALLRSLQYSPRPLRSAIAPGELSLLALTRLEATLVVGGRAEEIPRTRMRESTSNQPVDFNEASIRDAV